MGAVGGAAFHFLKGTYNSPRGDRLLGGVQAVQMNAPRVGGSFAVWGGLFSTFDCTMVYVRQKEDPWNSIIAGAATGGFLQMRQGLGAASRSAVFGGVLLAMIEGAGIMLNKLMSAPQNLPPLEETVPPNMGGAPPMGHLSNQPQVNMSSMSQHHHHNRHRHHGLEGCLVVEKSRNPPRAVAARRRFWRALMLQTRLHLSTNE
ncbi:hypothetical protein HanRHA438_Chr03g0135581 [Helianthus annuus]|nr:hypothetical protein HanRHA438_Chr03g0135581 [Helianthus annuus]